MGDAGRSGGGGPLGGGRGGGMPIPGGVAGGGIGGIILVVIVIAITMFMGGGGGGAPAGSALDDTRMSDTGRYEHCKTGADANDDADCARVAIENSLYDYWSGALPEQSNASFQPERRIETFSGGIGTGCGSASADVGPFYCPTDQTIYLDTTFF